MYQNYVYNAGHTFGILDLFRTYAYKHYVCDVKYVIMYSYN